MKPGDTINIVKKKTKTNNSFLLVLVIALGFLMLILSGIYKGSDRVLSHKSDDDKDNGGDYKNNDNKGGNYQYQSPSPTYSQPTGNITTSPTIIITPILVQPTITVTASPAQESVTPTETLDNPVSGDSIPVENASTNYESVPQDNSKNEEVVVVPVSERSVISTVNSNTDTRVVAPTRSLFKKIESKIKGVGGSGQFLSRPKSVATPTPIKKEDDFSPPVALGPDSSIFYMLTDTELLLGAVDKEDKRINVDEVELRGAEITMDKVLKKKGLDLGVSSGGSLVLTENGTRAYFEMPVFVDVFSHDISVDTANGKKQIKITPAKAVVNAIDSGYLENVDRKAKMTMEVKDGELVYKLEGDKEFNLLGRFNTKGIQYVYVDVETGDVAEGDQPLLSRILKLISL